MAILGQIAAPPAASMEWEAAEVISQEGHEKDPPRSRPSLLEIAELSRKADQKAGVTNQGAGAEDVEKV